MFTTQLVTFIALVYFTSAFSPSFRDFLERDPEKYDFLLEKQQVYGHRATFGGGNLKSNAYPIIFFHGNGDHALSWRHQIETLESYGFPYSRMFGITYGAGPEGTATNRFNCTMLIGQRRLIEAVLEYTNAERVTVEGFSMGVTIIRIIIKGGDVHLENEVCELGPSLADKIDVFVGISGANYGFCNCIDWLAFANTCNNVDGFWPGNCGNASANTLSCGTATSECSDYSLLLQDLNNGKKEADRIISIFSVDDPILGKDNVAWTRQTSIIPNTDKVYAMNGFDHFGSKDFTIMEQASELLRVCFADDQCPRRGILSL